MSIISFLLFILFIIYFLRHPIANKANMKGGGSEMPAKRKMSKERGKDKPKKGPKSGKQRGRWTKHDKLLQCWKITLQRSPRLFCLRRQGVPKRQTNIQRGGHKSTFHWTGKPKGRSISQTRGSWRFRREPSRKSWRKKKGNCSCMNL